MIGAGGQQAGDVYIAGGRRATVRIEVAYAVPNGMYGIQVNHGVGAPGADRDGLRDGLEG